ncbi:hypothetical protein Ahy_B02g058461 [Arachis hypogaea]|uniref:Uncharacterized protein n=1 Tax=Arachis hypogaea TaxID=3818 RepID=A0A445AEP1_ARAHY|nr:hypothetical protein Ahy_B02g058461 [Arachis hypogaea]
MHFDNSAFQRVFHYEDNRGGRIKRGIIQRIGKSWKNTRNLLFYKFYDSRKTFEKNANHKPSGIDANHWKWFLEYWLKDDTKEKCKKNVINRSKQRYTHTGGSKTMARKRHEEEAIAHIESQDASSKELSQNDSFAQVLGKEHPERVRGLGFRPCPTQCFRNIPQ